MSKKVGIVVGSLRNGAFSRKVAQTVVDISDKDLEFEFIEIGDLPIYNQDFDDNIPEPETYKPFRNKIKEMDALLFVTPEYNRSVPSVLKNALDVGSRPYGSNVWSGKPGAIISVSPGNIGGFGANHHLRQILAFLNVYTLQQPEMYLSNITEYIDDEGNVHENTKKFLYSFIESFDEWISNF